MFWEDVDADKSRENCKSKEGSGLSQRTWTDVKMELWTAFYAFFLTFSGEILCLPHYKVLGISGLKLSALLHWQPFWDVTLHKKWSFPLSISSVNVTKSAGTFTKEILHGKFHFLCSVKLGMITFKRIPLHLKSGAQFFLSLVK